MAIFAISEVGLLKTGKNINTQITISKPQINPNWSKKQKFDMAKLLA
jgi:hypothetical protein